MEKNPPTDDSIFLDPDDHTIPHGLLLPYLGYGRQVSDHMHKSHQTEAEGKIV